MSPSDVIKWDEIEMWGVWKFCNASNSIKFMEWMKLLYHLQINCNCTFLILFLISKSNKNRKECEKHLHFVELTDLVFLFSSSFDYVSWVISIRRNTNNKKVSEPIKVVNSSQKPFRQKTKGMNYCFFGSRFYQRYRCSLQIVFFFSFFSLSKPPHLEVCISFQCRWDENMKLFITHFRVFFKEATEMGFFTYTRGLF